MHNLNLPNFDAKIRRNGDRLEIFDPIRRKYVALTPEERVRQYFVNYLITDKRYPISRIANEQAIRLNGMTRRCDTVVYDDQLNPVMIIEYKEPSITISQKVFDQVTRYNIVLHVPFIAVSNGLQHYCCLVDFENQKVKFLPSFPSYEELLVALIQ